MIVALLNRNGGVGKATLALHRAGHCGREGKGVTVIDSELQGSVLAWSGQRGRLDVPRLFGVIGLVRATLHRDAPEMACDVDHVVIDRPPRIAGLMRSAPLAALTLIPGSTFSLRPMGLGGAASGSREHASFARNLLRVSSPIAASLANSSHATPRTGSPITIRLCSPRASDSASSSQRRRAPAASSPARSRRPGSREVAALATEVGALTP